jgi:hypothetical protein
MDLDGAPRTNSPIVLVFEDRTRQTSDRTHSIGGLTAQLIKLSNVSQLDGGSLKESFRGIESIVNRHACSDFLRLLSQVNRGDTDTISQFIHN